MLTIPPAIAGLLKSKMMVGANRPTGMIKLQSRSPGEPIDPFVDGTVVKHYLGISSSHQGISAPVPIAGGGFAFACTYKDVDDAWKVGIYFDADEGFFHDSLVFDSLHSTGISLVTDNPYGIYSTVQVSLFRRSDGKVLLFVNDRGLWDIGTSVKVYISNSGACNDFVYYSTIMELPPISYEGGNGTRCLMNVPLELPGGRLLITFTHGYRYSGEYNVARVFAYYSDNGGASWSLALGWGNISTAIRAVGQAAVTSDGRVYFETTQGSGAVRLWESVDNGASFTEVVTYYQGIYGYPGYCPSYKYDRLRIRCTSHSRDLQRKLVLAHDKPDQRTFVGLENWSN